MSKIVWKAHKPVRVYELSTVLGLPSKQVLYYYNQWQSIHLLRSASSKMTLTEALSFVDWMSK